MVRRRNTGIRGATLPSAKDPKKKAKHTHQDSKNYNLSNKKEQQNNKQQNNPVKFSFFEYGFSMKKKYLRRKISVTVRK